MPNTKDISLKDDPIKLLLVAENGSGKSIAASSFYKAGPIRIWDFDGRLKPIKSFFPDADIDYTTFGVDNFRDFLNELENIQDKCPWKTLILDSVTTASTACIVYQLMVTGNMKSTKGGIPATSWSEINGETVIFTKLLEIMKVLNKKYKCNIIFTAHPIPKLEISDSGTTRTTSIASYGNKIPALIPSYFDEIYSIQREKVGVSSYKHMVYTVPKNQLQGKTAFPGKIPENFDITGKSFYDELMSYLSK